MALAGVVLAGVVERLSPFPSAEPRRGTDEAFALGRLRRTLEPRQPPTRWTQDRDGFGFSAIPSGDTSVEVAMSGQTASVDVRVDHERIGTIGVGDSEMRTFPLSPRASGAFVVELVTSPGSNGARGAQLDRLTVRHVRRLVPSLTLCVLFIGPAIVMALGATRAGFGLAAASALGIAFACIEALLLWPSGLARSPYAATLGWLLTGSAAIAFGFARLLERRVAGISRAAFVCLTVAMLVQVVLATSPVMVVSDLIFHAHKLEQVVRGDYFPVSVTQHARPFTIPYGVSFYAVLAPFAAAGLDPAAAVRFGAGIAGLIASGGLFALLAPRGPWLASLATLVFQLIPANFDAFSYGNLSHVFGHALTLLFFAWWSGRRAGGFVVGALLLATGMVAHFASLITLSVLCVFLVALDYPRVATDWTRLLALALGFLLACAYYSAFLPLMLHELPGLREGAGATGQSRPLLDRVVFEVQWARIRWGLPAVLLAVVGWRPGLRDEFDRCLLAFWLAGASLALAALFSPLDVRYLYALTPALAVSAAAGAARLVAAGGRAQVLAWAAFAAQGYLGLSNILEAVYLRYRP